MAILARRRASLMEELERDAWNIRSEPFAALAGESHDAGDESVASTLVDTRRAELARDLAELRQVERALASGRYGVCSDCGTEISFDRLHAHPSATRCIGCEQRQERSAGRPGSL